MRFDNKLEYIVYDDKEVLVLIDKYSGYRNYNNRYNFLSLLVTILNLTDDEFANLEIYEKTLKYVLPINKKPYYKEKVKVNKAKEYIDRAIKDPLYKKYDTFKLACELKYFKEVTSKEFHDLSLLDKEQEDHMPDNEFERINYISKCCQKKKVKLVTAYELKDFEDFIVASMTELFKNNKNIKKCENCGKYFVPKRNDAKYCDNISPQNGSLTCGKYAPQKNYNDNLDELSKLYRKVYKKMNKNKERTKDASLFEKFKKNVAEWKAKIDSGEKTKEEYFEWLKEKDNNH